MTKELDIATHTLATYPEMNNPIKMEVGIEECLHIEFEYNKSKYHLKDVSVGKIYFLLVRIKIKHMEIAIIKRETTGSGPNTFHENETIAKYEIMDGAPVRGGGGQGSFSIISNQFDGAGQVRVDIMPCMQMGQL